MKGYRKREKSSYKHDKLYYMDGLAFFDYIQKNGVSLSLLCLDFIQSIHPSSELHHIYVITDSWKYSSIIKKIDHAVG